MEILKFNRLNQVLESPFFDFQTHFIFRVENPNTFWLLQRKSLEEFLINGKLIAHEVIIANCPCRLFFDIDFSSTMNNIWKQTQLIINDLYEVLKTELYHLALTTNEPLDIDPNQMHILTSFPNDFLEEEKMPELLEFFDLKNNTKKCGIHIICPNVVFQDIENVKNFVQHILPSLIYHEFYDCSVYRNNGTFRLINSIKSLDDRRRLLPLTLKDSLKNNLINVYHEGPGDFTQWIITPPCDIIPLTFNNEKKISNNTFLNKRQRACIKDELAIYNYLIENNIISNTFELDKVQNNFVHLRRTGKSYCLLCQREHDSENAWFVVWFLQNCYYITVGCYRTMDCFRQELPSHLVGICERPNSQTNEWFEINDDDYHLETNKRSPQNPKTFEEEILEWRSHSKHFLLQNQPLMDFPEIFSNSNVFIIGGMGTGKTVGLCNYIADQIVFRPELQILIVTSRRTLSAKLYSDYRKLNFQLYWETSGTLEIPRLITQVESLQRIDISKVNFELIIIDEAITILEQLNCRENNALAQLRLSSLQNLIILLRQATNIIIMDAYASMAMFTVFQSLAAKPTQIIVNIYPITQKRTITFANSLAHGVEHLVKTLRELKPEQQIFIACEERRFANALYSFLKERFPILTIQLITGNTDDNLKTEIFQKVNDNLTKNITIYTNVVSAGISFTKPVLATYGFAKGKILHARTLIQMMGRPRNCSFWIIAIPINNKTKKDLPSWTEITQTAYLHIISKPHILQLSNTENFISKKSFQESYLAIALFNATLELESKYYFYKTLEMLLKRYDYISTEIFDGLEPEDPDAKDFENREKDLILQSKIFEANLLYESYFLTYDLEELTSKSQNGQAMTTQERDFIESHNIVNFYQYQGIIDMMFFLNYRSPWIRRLWLRVAYALNHPFQESTNSEKETLETVQFSKAFQYVNNIKNQVFLVHGSLHFDQLRAARQLMNLLGFTTHWSIKGFATIFLQDFF